MKGWTSKGIFVGDDSSVGSVNIVIFVAVNSIGRFLKDWALVISMCAGAAAYIVYHNCPALHPVGPLVHEVIVRLQPVLIFAMLFFAFSKVDPRKMRFRPWMLPALLIQVGIFAAMVLLVHFIPMKPGLRLLAETAMLCFICPTATACSVVAGKLGADVNAVVTYTVLINIAVALVCPLMLPLVGDVQGLSFGMAFLGILRKIFPTLIVPFLLAWLLRIVWPKGHDWVEAHSGISFVIWVFSLSLAILMSTRSIMLSAAGLEAIVLIALMSLLCCVVQFALGRRLAGVTAGQSLGQKNTVFAIWLAYTFLNPLISVAGGFYSIWHNIFNSIQLKRYSQCSAGQVASSL